MTDIRRTVLWMVFTASLVLLWDGWQKYNGHPSMFSPTPAKPVASAAPAPGNAASGSLPTASSTGAAAAPA
ncbi:MAG TPA: membrane protein insertase YidC, partial [Burkholderiaceae bacterium]|nr:membrane protein insertase YidC [Burkholderiaceae bacterium]